MTHALGLTSTLLAIAATAQAAPDVQDRYVTPGLARIYWEAAREPKVQHWYDTSHELTDPRALVHRARFLEAQLHLRPVAPLLLRQMGLQTSPGRGARQRPPGH